MEWAEEEVEVEEEGEDDFFFHINNLCQRDVIYFFLDGVFLLVISFSTRVLYNINRSSNIKSKSSNKIVCM